MDGIIDTSVIVDLLRNYSLAVQWQKSNSQLHLAITPIVWMEVVQGTTNKQHQRAAVKVLQQFQMVQMIHADMAWAMNQHMKFYLSHNIGMMDCLIAAPAHRLQKPLYTRNSKHFIPMIPTLVQQPY